MPNKESTSEPRDRELTGVCFKNLNKRADKHPDWIGKATLQGKPYEVALWEKTSLRNGELFFSMSFRPDWDDNDIDPSLRELYHIGEDLFRLGCWVHEAHSERDPEQKLKKVLDALNQAHKALSKFAPPLNVTTLPATI